MYDVTRVSSIHHILNAADEISKVEELHEAIKNNKPIEKIASLLTFKTVNEYHKNVCAIHLAVGNVELLKLLLESGAQVDALTQDHKKSALHLAFEKKDLESVKLLLARKANPNQLDAEYGTILNRAAYSGSYEMVQLLLKAGASVNNANPNLDSPLSWGVRSGNEKMVEFLLTKCLHQINWNNSAGFTPLRLAFDLNLFSIAQMLVHAGANRFEENIEGKNFLHMAVESGRIENVKAVMEICKDISVNCVSKKPPYVTPIYLAVKGKWPEIVDFLLGKKGFTHVLFKGASLSLLHFASTEKIFIRLLEANADLSAKMEGRNVLHTAILDGRLEIAHFLISEKMVNIHEKTDAGETALHLAAIKGYLGIVQALLNAGADLRAQTNSFETPLFLVVKHGESNKSETVKFLLNQGADPNQDSGPENGTPLHVAAYDGNIELIDMLLEKGAKIDALKTKGHNSILVEAVRSGKKESVKHLIEKGALVNQKCGLAGGTVLHFAAASQDKDMMEMLVSMGGDLFLPLKNHHTCLYIACKKGNAAIVDYCLEKGLSVTEKGANGDTPLHIAAFHGFADIVEKLINKGADIFDSVNQKTPFFRAMDGFSTPPEKRSKCGSIEEYNRTFEILLAQERDYLEGLFKEFDSSNDKKASIIKIIRSLYFTAENSKLLSPTHFPPQILQTSGGIVMRPISAKVDVTLNFIKGITPFFWSHLLTSSFWQTVRALPFESYSQIELEVLRFELENFPTLFRHILTETALHEFMDTCFKPVINEISKRLPASSLENILKKQKNDSVPPAKKQKQK